MTLVGDRRTALKYFQGVVDFTLRWRLVEGICETPGACKDGARSNSARLAGEDGLPASGSLRGYSPGWF